MSTILENCGKLEVRESPIEGFGVFATDSIKKGEILERVPFVLFPKYDGLGKGIYDLLNQSGFVNPREKYIENLRQTLGHKDPAKYYFKWLPPVPLDDGPAVMWTCLPLGFASIYNSKNSGNNNIGWKIEGKTFVFTAERDIEPNEELCSFYGYFMAEQGQIYPCAQSFGLGLDWFDGKIRCKAIRFGTLEEFESAKTNPALNRVAQIFQLSKDGGFTLARISAMLPNGEEKAAAEFPDGVSLVVIYSKLVEFHNSPFGLFKITAVYENKEGQPVREDIIFRK